MRVSVSLWLAQFFSLTFDFFVFSLRLYQTTEANVTKLQIANNNTQLTCKSNIYFTLYNTRKHLQPQLYLDPKATNTIFLFAPSLLQHTHAKRNARKREATPKNLHLQLYFVVVVVVADVYLLLYNYFLLLIIFYNKLDFQLTYYHYYTVVAIK